MQIKNAACLRMFRMEPKLVQAVVAYAQKWAERRDDVDANIAVTVRMILRLQLGMDVEDALDAESHKGFEIQLRGLRIERSLDSRIEIYRKKAGLSKLGAIRHLLRLALGWSEVASRKSEDVFVQIADARRSMMGG